MRKILGAALFVLLASIPAFAQGTQTGGGSGGGSGNATQIQGVAVSASTPSTNNCLVYNGTQWAPGSCSTGSGSVTNIATTGPITGGPITTTGTIACPTCGVTGSPLSQFAATTSAQLRGVISDESGTGAALFANGAFGTPTSLVLTNATGLPCGATPALTGAVTTSAGSCATSASATIVQTNQSNTYTTGAQDFTAATSLLTATQAASDASTKAASTQYVTTAITNAIAAVNPAVAVLAASTANVTGTYTSVAGGIGDTFTVTATGAFTLDGVSINTIGQRILLKNQTDATQNGIYTATVVGVSLVSPVFTRALDYDQPSDVNSTGAIPVQSGTANTTTSWLLTSNITSIGPAGSAFTYVQFSVNPSNVVTASSPGVGLCHFAGSTQACTSSAVNLAGADVTGKLPIGSVGSAGLSATSPMTIAPTGVIALGSITAVQGTDTSVLSSGTVSASTGVTLCTDANHGATTSGCSGGIASGIIQGGLQSATTASVTAANISTKGTGGTFIANANIAARAMTITGMFANFSTSQTTTGYTLTVASCTPSSGTCSPTNSSVTCTAAVNSSTAFGCSITGQSLSLAAGDLYCMVGTLNGTGVASTVIEWGVTYQ